MNTALPPSLAYSLRERARDTERHQCAVPLWTHPLADSCRCPGQGSNMQPWRMGLALSVSCPAREHCCNFYEAGFLVPLGSRPLGEDCRAGVTFDSPVSGNRGQPASPTHTHPSLSSAHHTQTQTLSHTHTFCPAQTTRGQLPHCPQGQAARGPRPVRGRTAAESTGKGCLCTWH